MNNIIILKKQLLRYILSLLGVIYFSIQQVYALCIYIHLIGEILLLESIPAS